MQLDFPNTPTPGQVYPAPNGVTYTYDNTVGTGVWVAAVSAPLSVTPGSISGTAAVGSTLTYTPGTASGGSGPYTYAWQWRANGVAIAGQTGATYTVVAGNAGQSITVQITATDSTTATANAVTAPVAIPTALTVTAGSISGTAQVGQTLTYTPGTASGGVGPYTYAYQWNADGVAIAGATALTYVPVFGDVGKVLTVTITATDSTSVTANATTAPTAAVATSTIPTASFNPTPSTGPTASNTVATGTWNGTADSLTSSGCIELSVNGGAYSQGPTAVATGNTVTFRWVSSAGCTGQPNGTVINGTLSAASGGTNNYSLTVDTAPSNFSFTDLTAQPLSSAATSASITLAGTNVDTYLTTTGGTLTAIEASINGGGFVAVPASGTSLVVPPGATIQIRGTTGATVSTGYTAILALGTATTTWTATTVAAVPTVTTPSITAPVNGATNLNPAVNSPAGITVTSSAFASSGGAGTDHASSDWELATDAGFTTIVFSATASTTSKTSWFIPQANLTVSTTYYVRVRYNSGTDPGGAGTATTSSYSAGSSFATASAFTIPPGTLMGGGYFAGQINDGGTIYNLIVAPVADGQYPGGGSGGTPTGVQYKTSNSADANPNSQNEVYGKLATDQFNDAAHPAFQWAKGLTIGGFNDWYIPAKNELEILYFNLKPTTDNNNTSSGINPNAVPPRTSNYPSGGPPVRTTNALFQSGGAQAISTADSYWSSSEGSSGTTGAWRQFFGTGIQSDGVKKGASLGYARAVRRIPV